MFKPQVNEFLFNGATVADGTRPVNNSAWGTSITPAQDAYGAAFGNLGVLSATYDIYEWTLGALIVGVAGVARVGMVQVYADPAGGSSFTIPIVADLCVASAASHAQLQGAEKLSPWRFRHRIPAGWSIGVKGAVHSATLTAFRVWIYDAVGRPTRPDLARTHAYCDTFGVTQGGGFNCQGTAITPGTTSDGAWTEIGTLTRKVDWWEYALALDDLTASASTYHVDIALGDATNKRVIISNHETMYNAAEMSWRSGPAGIAAIGNSGDKVYARAQSSAALDDGTYTVAVYGCGG